MRRALSPALLALAAVAAAGLVVYLAVRPASGPGPGPRATTDPASPPGPVIPTGGEERAPLPLGEALPAEFPYPGCPAGHECRQLAVSCPNVRDEARVTIAIAPPRGDARGVVALSRGGGGRDWWADEGSTASFLADVRDEGLAVVQVRWKDEWLGAASRRAGRASPPGLPLRHACITSIHATSTSDWTRPSPAPAGAASA